MVPAQVGFRNYRGIFSRDRILKSGDIQPLDDRAICGIGAVHSTCRPIDYFPLNSIEGIHALSESMARCNAIISCFEGMAN